MLRNFEPRLSRQSLDDKGARFVLQVAAGVLAALNLAALWLYLAPPGGSRSELRAQSAEIQRDITAARRQTVRLKSVSGKVELGSRQSGEFEGKYFLSKRAAYQAVIQEIQRMASEAGLREREWVANEEPIEGTADLSLLNVTSGFEGPYDGLMKFVNAADHSPMLLMLDTLQAAPQQRSGQISTSIRFQAVIRDEPAAASGGER